jgi:predicted flavoprotein YhiN
MNEDFEITSLPGVFAAGEMLDWEAPTGGYLLTACLATGRAAGLSAAAWLKSQEVPVEQPEKSPPAT